MRSLCDGRMKCYQCKKKLPECPDCLEAAITAGIYDKWYCNIDCMNDYRKEKGWPPVESKDVLPQFNIPT